MKPISTRAHAVLDYLSIGGLFALSRRLHCSAALKQTLSSLAASRLIYTLFTRHEGGLIRVLPMESHIALDLAAGAALCVAPVITNEDNPAAALTCIAIGAGEIAGASMTRTDSHQRSRPFYTGSAQSRSGRTDQDDYLQRIEELRTPAGENL